MRRRSTTTTTERNPAARSSGLKSFCKQVIRTISESAGGPFEKVGLYQEIWYLVSKYEVPVGDYDTDIVVLVDQLCRDDASLAENTVVVDAPVVKQKPDKPVMVKQKSDYASVAKFPRLPSSYEQQPESHHAYQYQASNYQEFLSQKLPRQRTEAKPEPPRQAPPPRIESPPPGKPPGDFSFTRQRTDPGRGEEVTIVGLYPRVRHLQPSQAPARQTPQPPALDVITMRNPEPTGPRDILVSSSLSFGQNKELSSHESIKGERGNQENHQQNQKTNQRETTTVEPLRRGTVESLPSPHPRPTPPPQPTRSPSLPPQLASLPPVVATSSLQLENSHHPAYLDRPEQELAWRAGRLRPRPYTDLYQQLYGEQEQPARSVEELGPVSR